MKPFRLLSLLYLISTFFSFAHHSFAAPHLGKIIERVENRQSVWMVMQASLELHATRAESMQAHCNAELLFDRMKNNLLLNLYTKQDGNLLFSLAFRGTDFKFYDPSQGMLYTGNIFDLEDSEEFNSHLQPYDLYRALIPTVWDKKRLKIISRDQEVTTLLYRGQRKNKDSIQQLVNISDQGDVLTQIYFKENGDIETTLFRAGFSEHKGHLLGTPSPVIYPTRITIERPNKEITSLSDHTQLVFSRIAFLDRVDEERFEIPLQGPVQTLQVRGSNQ